MPTSRRNSCALLLMLLAGCGKNGPSTPKVRIAVGGAEQIVYLPTTLAQQLGYYASEGLDVSLENFRGGAKALQALLGGSADVVSGFYDHTLQMAAEGKQLQSFVLMVRYPGLVAVVAPQKAGVIRRVEDLKGATVGVTAPGSSTHLFLNYLLRRAGLSPSDVSATGIGGASTAAAAVERGKVDAAVMTEPALSQVMKRAGSLTILADTRTEAGVRQNFGSAIYPASVLYARAEWLDGNPDTMRRLASAIRRTLAWIAQHSPEEIAGKMPAEYRGADTALYVEALKHSMAMFSPDGVMQPEGPEAVKRVLSATIEKVKDVDVTRTYR